MSGNLSFNLQNNMDTDIIITDSNASVNIPPKLELSSNGIPNLINDDYIQIPSFNNISTNLDSINTDNTAFKNGIIKIDNIDDRKFNLSPFRQNTNDFNSNNVNNISNNNIGGGGVQTGYWDTIYKDLGAIKYHYGKISETIYGSNIRHFPDLFNQATNNAFNTLPWDSNTSNNTDNNNSNSGNNKSKNRSLISSVFEKNMKNIINTIKSANLDDIEIMDTNMEMDIDQYITNDQYRANNVSNNYPYKPMNINGIQTNNVKLLESEPQNKIKTLPTVRKKRKTPTIKKKPVYNPELVHSVKHAFPLITTDTYIFPYLQMGKTFICKYPISIKNSNAFNVNQKYSFCDSKFTQKCHVKRVYIYIYRYIYILLYNKI